jgi:hypothetical protein
LRPVAVVCRSHVFCGTHVFRGTAGLSRTAVALGVASLFRTGRVDRVRVSQL